MSIIWTKYWQGSDDGTILKAIDLKNIQDDLSIVQTVNDVLSIPGETQGDLLYYNGADWVRLAAGTAGQVLTTQGAGVNPTYEDVVATDLDMTSQATGDLMYYDGANWVVLPPGTSGDVLTSNGAGVVPSYTSVGTGGGVVQTFTANGTFTAPTGVTKVFLTMIGGGGSGEANSGTTDHGSGGGGGGYVMNYVYTVTPASNYAVVIGAGGTGAQSSTDNGDASTFDGTITAPGGEGGGNTTPQVGGLGGGTGFDATTSTAGGYSQVGGAGGGISGSPGPGGGTPFGAGAPNPASINGTPGVAGTANTGAGGSGSYQQGLRAAGGNGGSGIVIVMY